MENTQAEYLDGLLVIEEHTRFLTNKWKENIK